MKVCQLGQIAVHHSDAIDAKYTVAEKAFPPDLMTKHTSFNGKPIHWIANFGYQHKATGAAAAGRLDEPYDIELAAHHIANAQLVYFDGAAVQPLPTRPSDTTPGKVKATLDLGDPPIGWVSR